MCTWTWAVKTPDHTPLSTFGNQWDPGLAPTPSSILWDVEFPDKLLPSADVEWGYSPCRRRQDLELAAICTYMGEQPPGRNPDLHHDTIS